MDSVSTTARVDAEWQAFVARKKAEELVKAGMQVTDFSDAERQKMREKLQAVTAKYRGIVGEDVSKEFFDALAKTPH